MSKAKAAPRVSDELWGEIEPLLPKHPRNPKGGAPRKPDRPCLEGIVHVLRTGCQWQELPESPLWPSGSTCWRRFAEWTRCGVWPQLHRRLLNLLGVAGAVDLDRVVVDSASVRAKKGARTPGRARSTAARTAVNATRSPTPTGCRCWS
jgi:transposase